MYMVAIYKSQSICMLTDVNMDPKHNRGQVYGAKVRYTQTGHLQCHQVYPPLSSLHATQKGANYVKRVEFCVHSSHLQMPVHAMSTDPKHNNNKLIYPALSSLHAMQKGA